MSSSDIAISVRNISKAYTIAHQRKSNTRITEAIADWIRHRGAATANETFWALRDITFDVHRGEVLGIIGRNGAGKSTLLKILSRITEPTIGEIDLYGRIGSLLEVGTGFHPELTGRENIFLNGAILGMTRPEIRKQFDAIVDFADVERFLDTPVKRYSSGMYVRLAFAVAAHLNPEILIVDEVLAVGDNEFQRKCLGKMQDLARGSDRTVIFVSHNMPAVESLCTRVVFLKEGRVEAIGPTKPTLQRYLGQTASTGRVMLRQRRDRSGSGVVRLTSFHVEDSIGRETMHPASGMDVTLVLGYEIPPGQSPKRVEVGLSIHTEEQQTLSVIYSSYTGDELGTIDPTGEFCLSIPRLPLAEGRYRIGARVLSGGVEADWPRDGIATIEVESGDFYGTGSRGFGPAAPLMLNGQWKVRSAPPEVAASASERLEGA